MRNLLLVLVDCRPEVGLRAGIVLSAMTIVVLGAGSWGTALSLILARNGHSVHLIAHTLEAAEKLERDRENLQYLPGFPFPSSIEIVGPGKGLVDADFGVVAVPSAGVRKNLHELKNLSLVCVASKGLDSYTGQVLSDVVLSELPHVSVAALSGPNLAVELAKGIPTAAVAASKFPDAAELVRSAFMGATYRVYASDDLVGVELAGALKNVIAIGAGISDGMGFGDNTKGAFVSRGLIEMVRLGLAHGAKMETFLGLAGVGDLFATAASTLSRNYRVGRSLGEGKDLATAMALVGQVAEGVPTCGVAIELAAKLGVDVPLMNTLYGVMHGHIGLEDSIRRLMDRKTLRETDGLVF